MASDKTARRVFVLQIHREVAEMSSAELLSHILVKYGGLLSYARRDIGDEIADTAERSFTAIVNELTDRFCVSKHEVAEHAAATLAMFKTGGGGDATS